MIKKSGDTLIEVAFAIGIFSMVAIIVVSVISASTTGAQSSLELTLTREELDAQAEALRFIHDSYVSGSQSQNTEENRYANLWNNITKRAAEHDDYIEYNPTTCSELYPNAGILDETKTGKSPFFINTRALNEPDNALIFVNETASTGKVFYETETYPRVIYGVRAVGGNYEEGLYNHNEAQTISRVEGIFIIAMKGEDVTVIDGSTSNPQSAYYDFYIRSCWMPLGSDRASTISTVVRLYDPAVIDYN